MISKMKLISPKPDIITFCQQFVEVDSPQLNQAVLEM